MPGVTNMFALARLAELARLIDGNIDFRIGKMNHTMESNGIELDVGREDEGGVIDGNGWCKSMVPSGGEDMMECGQELLHGCDECVEHVPRGVMGDKIIYLSEKERVASNAFASEHGKVKQILMSIECGEEMPRRNGGIIYRQQFGEAFIKMLKEGWEQNG